MITASKEKETVKEFKIRYPLRDYTYPKEAVIDKVRFDETYMHVVLGDGRIVSIPLKWIPTLRHAKPAEREKYQINQTRRMIVWDPSVCEINEEIRIEDYLGVMQNIEYSNGDERVRAVREQKASYQKKKK